MANTAYTPGLLSSALTDKNTQSYKPELIEVDNEKLKEDLANKRNRKKNAEKFKNKSKLQISRAEKKEKDARTIFVGNIPVDVKSKQIIKFFKKHGPIDSVRIRSVAVVGTKVSEGNNYKLFRKASVIQGKINRDVKDTCNAYVVFKNKDTAEKALADNNSIFHGNHLRIDTVSGSTSGVTSTKKSIFVGNIPFDASEEALRQVFALGISGGDESIVNVRLIRDKAKNVGKGFGYVEFSERSFVKEALALNGTHFENRQLRITKVVNKQKLEEKKQKAMEKKLKGKSGGNSNYQDNNKKTKLSRRRDGSDGNNRRRNDNNRDSKRNGSGADFQGEKAKFGAYLRIKRKRKDRNKPKKKQRQ
jgi:nucleolar protein 12